MMLAAIKVGNTKLSADSVVFVFFLLFGPRCWAQRGGKENLQPLEKFLIYKCSKRGGRGASKGEPRVNGRRETAEVREFG